MKLLRFFFPQKPSTVIKREYHIPHEIKWHIELNKNGLVATSDELPGLVTNAKNPEELLEMINDAVLEYYNVPKLESDYVYNCLNVHGTGTVYLKQLKERPQYGVAASP